MAAQGARREDVVTPEQWARVNTLFHAALEQTPDARANWLSHSAADDEAVRREVEALLAAYAREPEFLDTGAEMDARTAIDSLDPSRPHGPAASLVGQQIGGYEITRELGRGGMAIVYLAHDPRLQRDVAIKIVRGNGGRDGDHGDTARRERLRREARAVALLDHPGIATIHALEEHGDELYIVTEYVRGETLREELARGPLAPDRLLDTVIGITRVIAAAHAKGIIHRDLKPENVMRTSSGEIKILDFGLARVSASWAADMAPTLTHAGGLLGTPAYMAPEQIRSGEVDERADVFALGVMFYELAYGVHPFGHGSIATTLHRILSEPPVPFSEHEQRIWWIEPILERCFKKDSAERYTNAGDLLQALSTASASASVSASASASASASDESATVSASASGTGQGLGRGPLPASAALTEAPPQVAARANAAETGARASQWWWQFHQLAAAAFLALVVVPAWRTWEWIVPDLLRELIRLTTLVVVPLAVSLRLHIWFMSRYDPSGLREQRPRTAPWIRLADWGFALAMLAGALAIMPTLPAFGATFVVLSVCYAVAFLVVEPATARAAFRESARTRP
jgi:serine/threonine protein kinase